MKKPNLTDGKWFVEEKSPSSDWGLNWSVRSRLSQHVSECITPVVFHKADAKAISAVPDMIDALIAINESEEAREVMGSIARSKMINALKKAGCENDY